MNRLKIMYRYLVLMFFTILLIAYGNEVIALPWPTYAIPFAYIAIKSINRLVPRFNESIAFSKQFAINYEPLNPQYVPTPKRIRPLVIALGLWSLGLTIVGILYFVDIIQKIHLYWLVCLFYFFEVICTDVWCPFKSFIFKNKCCNDCRLGNWDRLFLVSPLIFAPSWFSIPLIILAIAVVIQWEYSHYMHNERFYNNRNLKCKYCERKNRCNKNKN